MMKNMALLADCSPCTSGAHYCPIFSA